MNQFNSWISNVQNQINSAFQAAETENVGTGVKTEKDEQAPSLYQNAEQFTNSLYSLAKVAGTTLTSKASEIRQQIENAPILSDFDREQRAFTETQSKVKTDRMLPWSGAGEQTTNVKKQVLSLSLDSRNFVRAPPTGTLFTFAMDDYAAQAMAMVDEDPNLRKMRLQLVPKAVSEEQFWKNYFYRISLIKQSLGLEQSKDESDALLPEEQPSVSEVVEIEQAATKELTLSSSTTDDRAQISESDLSQVRKELGLHLDKRNSNDSSTIDGSKKHSPGTADGTLSDNWEADILAELNDYELVKEQTGRTDEEWEKEISDLLD